MSRFTIRPGVREQVPLLVGIVSKSSGGKTYSALRLATGIQKIVGGEIVGIDTEAGRMRHYADEFKFHHLPMGAPFGSLDYIEAIEAALKFGAKTIIVDSMSHEHEGPGGYLDLHEQEVIRLCKPTKEGGGGFSSAFAAQIPAWAEPARRRRRLINYLVQTPANFVFCFRAKDKVELPNKRKPGEKAEIITHANQPIAGEEFVYEQLVRFLLMPGCDGVPDWSEEPSAFRVAKMTKSVEPIFRENGQWSGRKLDEWTGRQLARWALGTKAEGSKEDPPPAEQNKPAAAQSEDGPTQQQIYDEAVRLFDMGELDQARDVMTGLTDDNLRARLEAEFLVPAQQT